MKLLMVIVQNEDAAAAMAALVNAGLRVTRLASTGGLLGRGSTTLISGLDEADVGRAVDALSEVCQAREVQVAHGHPLFSTAERIRMGGAVGFVVDVERFFKL